MHHPQILSALVAVAVCGSVTPQNAVAAPFDFGRDIYGVMQRACFECHGESKQEGDLRLDTKGALESSGTVVAAHPEQSELMRRIALPRGHDEVMPALGDRLSSAQVKRFREWIAAGAEWPESFTPPEHWAYVPPRKSALPNTGLVSYQAHRNWPRQPLDYFVLQRLGEEGLQPSAPASPAVLIRRVFLDLVGLPPTPEEVNRFLADPTDEAYSRLVDDLLERPQFGERWARPWLDLARYADSHGFQRDNFRDIWAYRDWVIRAFNEDMPFDQFTVEQIAGDLLPNATESQRIATGFHRCTPTNVEAGSLPEETRTEAVIDRVNTTAAVWLGSTIECAQCHDHKYDAFSMKEYYQLLAFFNNTALEADRTNPKAASSIQFIGPSMPISNPAVAQKRAALQGQVKQLRAEKLARRRELTNGLEPWAMELAAELKDAPQQHVLEVLEFESKGDTDEFEQLEDGSILLVGSDPPDVDEYTIRVKLEQGGIRGLRVDALTHESLPGAGPGRGDPVRRNFILSEFIANHGDRELKFKSARADFSQNKWPVGQAIDGDLKKGWAIAPKFGESHWATFELAEPLDAVGEEITIRVIQQYGSARTIGRIKLSAITGNLGEPSLSKDVAASLAKPATMWDPKDRKRVLDHRAANDAETQKLDQKIAALQAQVDALKSDTTLVMVELEKPRQTHMFQRGDYRTPGEPVSANTPAVLHPMPDGPPNRITLARWLVDRDNPLTARVTVNRWWAELFGRGIVATLEDFGVKGEPPTHPRLLDYLAVDLMEHDWSMKHVLRSIVLSATYRQTSYADAAMLEQDDQNRWLARGPRFRMDAEMIRDNALAISGLLSFKQFGPPIRPYQPDGIWSKVGGTSYKYEVSPGDDQHRRGIYVVLKRGAPYPSFINFDGSARLACVVTRSRTNTPLQALTLLNDPVYVEAAKGLALRMAKHAAGEAASNQTAAPPNALSRQRLQAGIEYGFQACTARMPSPGEADVLAELYQQQQTASNEQGEELASGLRLPKGMTPLEFSGWYAVASTMLNLHETITKP